MKGRHFFCPQPYIRAQFRGANRHDSVTVTCGTRHVLGYADSWPAIGTCKSRYSEANFNQNWIVLHGSDTFLGTESDHPVCVYSADEERDIDRMDSRQILGYPRDREGFAVSEGLYVTRSISCLHQPWHFQVSHNRWIKLLRRSRY